MASLCEDEAQPFAASVLTLMELTGISEPTVIQARRELIALKLADCKSSTSIWAAGWGFAIPQKNRRLRRIMSTRYAARSAGASSGF